MALPKTVVCNVKRSEPKLVVPEKPTPYEIKQLSDIDDQQGIRFLVPIIFFYPPVVGGKLDPAKTIRDGLAKALVAYYPFAGRIFEEPNTKLMVNCNNEGVLFAEADADVKLEQLDGGILQPWLYMEELLCKAPDSEGIIDCPLLFIQVTRFKCGGFSLGIKWNHTMADVHGLMLFLNAISELAKGASVPSIPPVWQRELLSARTPPRVTCTHPAYKFVLDPTNSDNVVNVHTHIFFGPQEIQALRNQLPANQINPSYSRFDLITACLWKSRTIALEPNPRDITRVSIIMDARQKKEIGIPDGYYGNGIVLLTAVSTAGILCGSPLIYALHLIRRAKAQLSEEYVSSTADLMVIKGRPKFETRLNFLASGLTSLGCDELDLGWGKPLYAGIPWVLPNNIINYTNIKNHKGEVGILVPVCLPPLAMEKFQNEFKKMTTYGTISKM